MIRKLTCLAAIAAIGLTMPAASDARRGKQTQAQKTEAAREKTALKQNLAQAKNRQKIGKAALKRAAADAKALGRQEATARKERLNRKPSVDQAFQNYRANKTPENKAKWHNAAAAYMPFRNAHENALAKSDKAKSDVAKIKDFQKSALANQKGAAAAAKIKPVPRARPKVAARFVVDISAPSSAAVANTPAGLLNAPAAPRRTQAYGQAPSGAPEGGAPANYGPASFVPQPPPTGAQLYTASKQGQRFKNRQNANEYAQPGDPLVF